MRRRRTNPALNAFLHAAIDVDKAQRALLAAIPTARRPGRALVDALSEFEAHLIAASAAIREWKGGPMESLISRCTAAIDSSLAQARDLAEAGRPLAFEELNARVGNVLHPLEEFADLERELRG